MDQVLQLEATGRPLEARVARVAGHLAGGSEHDALRVHAKLRDRLARFGDDGAPIDTNGISPGHIVVDLIYEPPETRLLARCEALKARCLNGMGMLLHQGAAAFTLWTGAEAPLDVMRQALAAGGSRPAA